MRQGRITDTVFAEINDVKSQSVLHFALAKIVQVRLPMSILSQIICDVFRKKDVSGVSAVHYPLGYVNSAAGDVDAVIDVPDLIDRPAVNPHPYTNVSILF